MDIDAIYAFLEILNDADLDLDDVGLDDDDLEEMTVDDANEIISQIDFDDDDEDEDDEDDDDEEED